MTHIMQNLLISLFAIYLFSPSRALAEKVYTPKERQVEEARIRKDIEKKLDWNNRSPEQLDDVSDADRWLYGGLNESILLRRTTGERFGIFESFAEQKNVKIFEIWFHKKNKITDRFLLYSSTEGCNKGIDIFAEQVTSKFVVYTTTCSSEDGKYTSLLLFDYASRNLYDFGFNYDRMESKAPRFKWQNGVYKLRWSVRLRGQEMNQSIQYDFKIMKDNEGKWTVKDLRPSGDDEDIGISSLKKLPINSNYDLPSFVADWDK